MTNLFDKVKVSCALLVAGLAVAAGEPRVENVQARQVSNTKDVEVTYDLVAPDGGLFKVSASFQAQGVSPEVKTVTGDFGSDVAPGRNRRFVWDAGTDWPGVEIALKPGWNLIGYPLLEEGEVEKVLATALATGNIRYISSGSRVYPGTLKTMAPGKGYWVYAEAAETIRFKAR